MAQLLVIDDDPAIRTMVRRFLASDGHEVIEAADGAEALALLEGRQIEAIVTDVYMPRMDGIELTRQLRHAPSRPAIIVMSGGGLGSQVDLLEVAGHLGAVATLTKPFTRTQLLDAVRLALSKGEAA